MVEKPFSGGIYKDASPDGGNKRRTVELTPGAENVFRRVVRPADVLRSIGLNPLEPLQRFETDEMSPKQIADVDLHALEKANLPNILLNMPHAGEFVPEYFWLRMTEDGKKSTAKLDAEAYNSEFFGNRRKQGEHINMIQIETNEAAFIDFSRGYFDARYDFGKLEIVRRLLEASLLKIAPLLQGEATT